MAENSLGFRNEGGEPAAQVFKDALLVERLRQGEDSAYEELLSTYEDSVHNLVYRLLNQPVDAPDVVQEVFVKVYRNLNHFQGKSTLKTWIYRIAVNEAYNHRRWFSQSCTMKLRPSSGEAFSLAAGVVLENQRSSMPPRWAPRA